MIGIYAKQANGENLFTNFLTAKNGKIFKVNIKIRYA